MLDPAIQNFLNDRKENWLKKKIKSNTSDEEKAQFEQSALEDFSLASWLPNAAKRAKQLSLVSHPGKFTHPSARISSIIATEYPKQDGFVRTGNVKAELDVLGNAAALDVYKFLSLELEDGQTILSHLEQSSERIKQQLAIPTAEFQEIENGLMAIKSDNESQVKTSGKIKQVYFPVNKEQSDYHLLSIVTPSNLMFKLKERINDIRFSDEAKLARECRRQNKPSENGFSDIPNLSVIGFGGTKPQNISVLNSNNGGTAYLLASLPPQLEKRTIQPPRDNFFGKYLKPKHFREEFEQFHQQLIDEKNNFHIRYKRDQLVKNIIFQLADFVWKVRYLEAGWSDSDRYDKLPHNQKIWLDRQYRHEREEEGNLLDSINSSIARWFINSYQSLFGDDAIPLGDEQMTHLNQMILKCEGALK